MDLNDGVHEGHSLVKARAHATLPTPRAPRDRKVIVNRTSCDYAEALGESMAIR
jgi:hypothetical protein